MENNGWPEKFQVLPSLGDVARFCGRLLTKRHAEVERGAEAMLAPPFEPYQPELGLYEEAD